MEENPSYLPEEILIEIFSRIPAKAVGRCRCLSKKWRSKLSTPQFVNLHLLNRRNSPENLLVINPLDYSLHTVDAPIVIDKNVSRKLEESFGTWSRVLGCCNGLVLGQTGRELYLINPTTLQHFQLPPLPLCSDDARFRFSNLGSLGYDISSDDYKVVVIRYCIVGVGLFDRLIDVYSVKSGAWKRVDNYSQCCHLRLFLGAYLNGAIHWYSYMNSNSAAGGVIEAFDLANDAFREIPVPPHGDAGFRFNDVQVLQGCLCQSKFLDDNKTMELWMMKEYGLADSWTKVTISIDRELCTYRPPPLCFIGDREIVLVTDDNTFVVYNLEDGTTKDMVVDGVPPSLSDKVAFVDTLVLPNNQY